MKTIEVEITGISPLLMHSDRGVDPTDPLRIESREITSKGAKKRTTTDDARLLEIDFMLSLYISDGKVIVPEMNVLACLRDGARRSRKGKEILAGVTIDPMDIPLIYNGPKGAEKLYSSQPHRDVRTALVSRARVIRCRPRFFEWALAFNILFDPGVVDPKTLKTAMEQAGQFVGLCDFRPRFGRFEVTKWNQLS